MCCRVLHSLLRPTGAKSVVTSAVVHVTVGALAVIGSFWVSATEPARLPGQSRVIELQLIQQPPEPESPVVQLTVAEPVSLADNTPSPPEESVLVTPDRARLASRTFVPESTVADAWEMPDPTDPLLSERVAQLPLPARPSAPDSAASPPTETASPLERTLAARRPPQVTSAATPVPQQVGNDDQTPPDFSNNRPPRYPQVAQQRGWEGVVMLRITIAADGRVTRVKVAESSGYSVLDAEAANTVRTWRGTPARRGGKPIETEELLPVRFRLDPP